MLIRLLTTFKSHSPGTKTENNKCLGTCPVLRNGRPTNSERLLPRSELKFDSLGPRNALLARPALPTLRNGSAENGASKRMGPAEGGAFHPRMSKITFLTQTRAEPSNVSFQRDALTPNSGLGDILRVSGGQHSIGSMTGLDHGRPDARSAGKFA